MHRAYPILPTPVVPPLYHPPNSASGDSNINSPPFPEINSPSPPCSKRHQISSLISRNHTSQNLPIYSQQNEKLVSILRSRGRYTKSRNNRGVSDLNLGINSDDMNVTYEEADDYERGNVSRSEYELYRGQETVEDELQLNIPGAVVENCNHSTQIFVKVRSFIAVVRRTPNILSHNNHSRDLKFLRVCSSF